MLFVVHLISQNPKTIYYLRCGLKILDGISTDCSPEYGHTWEVLSQDGGEYLRGELLALVMSHDGNLYLLLVSEEPMISHFPREECIRPVANGFVEHKVSCATAQRNALYGTGQQFVVHEAFYGESLLDPL